MFHICFVCFRLARCTMHEQDKLTLEAQLADFQTRFSFDVQNYQQVTRQIGYLKFPGNSNSEDKLK